MPYQVRSFQITRLKAPENAEGLAWPARLASSPLDLEIGCGVGWHPIRYATENPERRLIAIEHTRAKFASFETRLESHRLENLRGVHADAIRWVAHRLKPRSIDRCFLLYPNPEPKASNKRWMRSPFMHCLLEILKPQGELVIATNNEGYFAEAVEWAEKAWHLEVVAKRQLTQMNFKSPRTHFEKKYLLRGETCFDAIFPKT